MHRWFGIRPKTSLESETPAVFDVGRDNTQLLDIFPRETWIRIAKKLEKTTDTINLSNSGTFFQTLLSNQRVQFLFKDVLQVVADQELLGKFYYKRRDNIHCYENKTEAKRIILNSRLVCHDWNNAVVYLTGRIESEWTCGLGPKKNNAIHHLFRTSFQISNLNQVNRFLKKFDDSTKNPFFSRTILITLTPHRMTPRSKHIYHLQIARILQLFGKHLWNCIFHESLCSNEDEPAYSILIDLLHYMPNLKHLELINRSVNTCTPQNFPVPPKLDQLKSLIFYSIFTPVCNAIVQANPHISRLTAQHPGYNEHVFRLSYHLPFGNLEQLELSWWSWREMRVLGENKTNMWPLRKLKLHFCEQPNIGKAQTTWFELFDILSICFGETLEELEINLPLIREISEIETIQKDSHLNILRLPKLQRLDLIVKNSVNFGFLLGTAKSLQYLHIEVRSFRKEFMQFWSNRYKQNVQIQGMYSNVLKSNIWSLFPRLKTVYVGNCCNLEVRHCNRSDWKKMQQVRYGPGVSRTRFNLWKRRVLCALTF